MKSNKRAIRDLQRNDEGVSPVIAVILMVAITVVLAATVYVWVSGFGASGEQAPAASFKVTNCSPDETEEEFKIKLLSSSRSLDVSNDLNFVVTEESTGDTVGGPDAWNTTTTTWEVGGTLTLVDDDDTTPGDDLSSGTTYVIDIVHTPSGNIIGSPQYTC